MTFDRFDICEAYYLFASGWHGGQFSQECRIFGRLAKFHWSPRPGLRSESDLTENGLFIYQALVLRFTESTEARS